MTKSQIRDRATYARKKIEALSYEILDIPTLNTETHAKIVALYEKAMDQIWDEYKKETGEPAIALHTWSQEESDSLDEQFRSEGGRGNDNFQVSHEHSMHFTTNGEA